jgi:hypothetical protein
VHNKFRFVFFISFSHHHDYQKIERVIVGSGIGLEFTGAGIPATDDGSNTKFDFSGIQQKATVTLTNADIKGLRATPKTLIAAPGAGKFLEFVSASLKLVAGANVTSPSAMG